MKSDEFVGQAVDVLKRTADDVSTVPPLVLQGETGTLVVASQPILRLVEVTYSRFLDELTGTHFEDGEVRLHLKGCSLEERTFAEGVFPTLATAVEVNAAPHRSDTFQKVYDLDPGSPEADFHHRYVEVPLCWSEPEMGTFRLYYELDSDYVEGRPAVLVPCDPQQSTSWVGSADRMKESLGIEANVVTFQYRGTFASKVPGLTSATGTDWVKAYKVLHTRNAVEDVDAVRRDLLGEDGTLAIEGGSGLAMMGLMYLAKYHRHVDRAFLMGLYHKAETGAQAVEAFFEAFLDEHDLTQAFAAACDEEGVVRRQLYHLLQRLLYSDQARARELIEAAAAGDLTVYADETQKQGDVDFSIRSVHRYWPQTAVFMYETNVPSTAYPDGGINAPFLAMGAPLIDLARQGRIPDEHMDICALEHVSTDVLLIAGTLDQVCPVDLMEAIHEGLPNSHLALLRAYHCLVKQKSRRARLFNTFLRHGSSSDEVRGLLHSRDFSTLFVELRPPTGT